MQQATTGVEDELIGLSLVDDNKGSGTSPISPRTIKRPTNPVATCLDTSRCLTSPDPSLATRSNLCDGGVAKRPRLNSGISEGGSTQAQVQVPPTTAAASRCRRNGSSTGADGPLQGTGGSVPGGGTTVWATLPSAPSPPSLSPLIGNGWLGPNGSVPPSVPASTQASPVRCAFSTLQPPHRDGLAMPRPVLTLAGPATSTTQQTKSSGAEASSSLDAFQAPPVPNFVQPPSSSHASSASGRRGGFSPSPSPPSFCTPNQHALSLGGSVELVGSSDGNGAATGGSTFASVAVVAGSGAFGGGCKYEWGEMAVDLPPPECPSPVALATNSISQNLRLGPPLPRTPSSARGGMSGPNGSSLLPPSLVGGESADNASTATMVSDHGILGARDDRRFLQPQPQQRAGTTAQSSQPRHTPSLLAAMGASVLNE